MLHDRKLEAFHLRGPLFLNKKPAREHLLQNNHKHVSRPKDINNNFDTSSLGITKATHVCNKRKLSSIRFDEIYDHINPMENTND